MAYSLSNKFYKKTIVNGQFYTVLQKNHVTTSLTIS